MNKNVKVRAFLRCRRRCRSRVWWAGLQSKTLGSIKDLKQQVVGSRAVSCKEGEDLEAAWSLQSTYHRLNTTLHFEMNQPNFAKDCNFQRKPLLWDRKASFIKILHSPLLYGGGFNIIHSAELLATLQIIQPARLVMGNFDTKGEFLKTQIKV